METRFLVLFCLLICIAITESENGHVIIRGYAQQSVTPPECTSDTNTLSMDGRKIGATCCDSQTGLISKQPCRGNAGDYVQAEDLCQRAGLTLCSRQQLYDQEGVRLGCKLADRMVWTSTLCNGFGYMPTVNPTRSPTMIPTIHTHNSQNGENETTEHAVIQTTKKSEENGATVIEAEEAQSTSLYHGPFLLIGIGVGMVLLSLCILCMWFISKRIGSKRKVSQPGENKQMFERRTEFSLGSMSSYNEQENVNTTDNLQISESDSDQFSQNNNADVVQFMVQAVINTGEGDEDDVTSGDAANMNVQKENNDFEGMESSNITKRESNFVICGDDEMETKGNNDDGTTAGIPMVHQMNNSIDVDFIDV